MKNFNLANAVYEDFQAAFEEMVEKVKEEEKTWVSREAVYGRKTFEEDFAKFLGVDENELWDNDAFAEWDLSKEDYD